MPPPSRSATITVRRATSADAGEVLTIQRAAWGGVVPDRQGEGIGSLLLSAVEAAAPAGTARLALYTRCTPGRAAWTTCASTSKTVTFGSRPTTA